MPQLAQLRDLVENGRTARWTFYSERSTQFYFDIKIKKVEEGVAWQHKVIQAAGNKLVSTQTAMWPTWDELYKGITGDGSSSDQTTTYGWKITDDPLDPYLPERRETPHVDLPPLFTNLQDTE
jgi:hypothetical protein